MRPLFFDRCFGWLHPAVPASSAAIAGTKPSLGIVLCGPLAQEEICAHHGLMQLADRLAAAGMPTLRFDYAGTGDSAEATVSIATLTESIRRAVDCLRQETGVRSVALCGLRIGGAFAHIAALEIGDIAGLVLLAPAVSGQSFLRELRAAASVNSLSLLDPVPNREAAAPLNTNGFSWSPSLLRELGGIELSAAGSPPARRMLVAVARNDRRTAAFIKNMRAAGALIEERPFPDYDAFIRDPTIQEMPDATFAAVTEWLSTLSRKPGLAVSTDHHPSRISPTLVMGQAVEEPLLFGPDDRLFGMLCRPVGASAGVAALILHEGSSYHIGNGGASVTMARRLAGNGFASLRMDLTGMGDSASAGLGDSAYYNLERAAEVSAAMDKLDDAGFPHIVVIGLCAGGFLAFHAGRQDPRTVGILAVNMQRFIWHEGDSLNVAVKEMRRSFRSYIRSLRNPGEWKRVLTGKADLVGTARVLGRRVLVRGVQAIQNILPPPAGSPLREVRDWMQGVADRGIHTYFVYSAEDYGLAEMRVYFGTGAKRLRNFGPATMTILPRADHHLNSTDARQRFTEFVEHAMAEIAAAHPGPKAAVRSDETPMPFERAALSA